MEKIDKSNVIMINKDENGWFFTPAGAKCRLGESQNLSSIIHKIAYFAFCNNCMMATNFTHYQDPDGNLVAIDFSNAF